MSKIASVLKEEITRLARKEINAQTGVLRKTNAQYRRDIAQLKRQAASLYKELAYLKRQERRRVATAGPQVDVPGARFSLRGLKTHRAKLGLSAAEYAALIGVTGQTIYNWEQGKSRPRQEQLAALVGARELGKREALKRLELLAG